MPAKKSVSDLAVSGKKVLLRCDFNVPLTAERTISDDKRIREALPTIRTLLDGGAAVILCSHLGRPKGERNLKYSLAPVAARLTELLGRPVALADDVVGESARAMAAALQPGEVMLLENVRFEAGEEKNDRALSQAFAALADLYVNDAFGTAHRAHASTAGVAEFLPSACGLLMQREIDVMGKALEAPERPFVAILGGAKIGDKIALIGNLLERCDAILVGGGMAFTFLKAQGGEIGGSLCDDGALDTARALLQKSREKNVPICLPVDAVCGKEFKDDTDRAVFPAAHIPAEFAGYDIGPETVAQFAQRIAGAKTVVWNGPMGVFELPSFAEGTRAVARAVAESDAVSIIGGGDSAAAVEQLGFADRVTHISTGGGAALEFLEGRTLPGIACLAEQE